MMHTKKAIEERLLKEIQELHEDVACLEGQVRIALGRGTDLAGRLAAIDAEMASIRQSASR
jgi:hypothetical protein